VNVSEAAAALGKSRAAVRALLQSHIVNSTGSGQRQAVDAVAIQKLAEADPFEASELTVVFRLSGWDAGWEDDAKRDRARRWWILSPTGLAGALALIVISGFVQAVYRIRGADGLLTSDGQVRELGPSDVGPDGSLVGISGRYRISLAFDDARPGDDELIGMRVDAPGRAPVVVLTPTVSPSQVQTIISQLGAAQAAVEAADESRRAVVAIRDDLVRAALGNGVSWMQIARTTGVTTTRAKLQWGR
jgi:hypothetical protein